MTEALGEKASLQRDWFGVITLYAAHSLGPTCLVVILISPEKNLPIHCLENIVEGKG